MHPVAGFSNCTETLFSSARSETAIESLSTWYQTGNIFLLQHSENFKQLIYDSFPTKINGTYTRRLIENRILKKRVTERVKQTRLGQTTQAIYKYFYND